MSFSFRLPNGDVGSYAWGSNLIRFTNWAQVSTDTALISLAGFTHSLSSWNSNAAFRGTIAFHHEIVHNLQDMLKGIGHWDYLVRHRYIPELNLLALKYSYDSTQQIPYRTDEVRLVRQQMRNELVMLPTSLLPTARRNQLANEVQSLAAESLKPDETIEDAFLIESMLEAEAVVTVAMHLARLIEQMPSFPLAILNQNRKLWAPFYMDRGYGPTIWFFRQSLDTIMGAAEDKEDKALAKAHLEMYYRLLIFFVDLACAYPPPNVLDSNELTRTDFEPGIRMARMFKTFLFLNDQDTAEFMNAMFGDNDLIRPEELLLQRTDFAYPSSARIYRAWLDLFDEMMKTSDDRLLLLRHDACRRRVDEPSSCVHKDLSTALTKQIPIYFLTPTGLNSHHFSLAHLEPDEFRMMGADLLRYNRDLAAMDFFFDTGRFICPLAEAKLCSARIAECTSGLSGLNQLPPSPGCSVRNAWKGAGWHLPDE